MGKNIKGKQTMLDGPVAAHTLTNEDQNIIRGRYQARLVDGDKIPQGMEIQGVDVIAPNQSRISYQQALGQEIDQIQQRGEQACIVIFKPLAPEGGNRINFNTYSDPNKYAVVTPDRALSLLGNGDKYQGLRNSVTRRKNAVLGIA
jgi:hypothetical protein